jgi:hypothetical protein
MVMLNVYPTFLFYVTSIHRKSLIALLIDGNPLHNENVNCSTVGTLCLQNCGSIRTLVGLENVPHLTVVDCPLLDLEGLQNNKKVIIQNISQSLNDEVQNGRYRDLQNKIPDITSTGAVEE